MVFSLKRGADCLHMVQLMSLHPQAPSSLASFKSRLVLPYWYQLTQVVLEKKLLHVCVCVCVSMCVCVCVCVCVDECEVTSAVLDMSLVHTQ